MGHLTEGLPVPKSSWSERLARLLVGRCSSEGEEGKVSLLRRAGTERSHLEKTAALTGMPEETTFKARMS